PSLELAPEQEGREATTTTRALREGLGSGQSVFNATLGKGQLGLAVRKEGPAGAKIFVFWQNCPCLGQSPQAAERQSLPGLRHILHPGSLQASGLNVDGAQNLDCSLVGSQVIEVDPDPEVAVSPTKRVG